MNGNGIQPPYNGHNTGAFLNVSNNHVYTGTVTLNTNATIGVTSGILSFAPASTATSAAFAVPAVGGTATIAVLSTTGFSLGQSIYLTDGTHTISATITAISGTTGLTIQTAAILAGNIGDTMASGAGVAAGIIDGGTAGTAYSLTKEGAGTLVLANPDAYQGNHLRHHRRPGSRKQRRPRLAPPPPLSMTGPTRIASPHRQQRLDHARRQHPLSVRHRHRHHRRHRRRPAQRRRRQHLAGQDLTLSSVQNFSSATSPAGVVAIYVDPGDTLTLSDTIAEGLPPIPGNGQAPSARRPASGLAEVGTGTLVLAGNEYLHRRDLCRLYLRQRQRHRRRRRRPARRHH